MRSGEKTNQLQTSYLYKCAKVATYKKIDKNIEQ